MQQPKSIYFEGRTYFLSPTNKKYYITDMPRVNGKRVKKQLHHAIWESHNKQSVPKGYDVHHVDRDYTNNSPENLEIIPKSEHARMHMLERLADDQQRQKAIDTLDKNRYKAAAWHGTDQGRAHSKKLLEAFWEKRETVTKQCLQCNEDFDTYFPDRAQFCSRRCTQAYKAKTKHYWTDERQCLQCGEAFKANRHSGVKCCSRSCAAKYRWANAGLGSVDEIGGAR